MLTSRMVAPVLVLGTLFLVGACNGREKQDRADLQQAHALFAEAEGFVAEAKLKDASARYSAATALLHAVRMRATRPGAAELADGPLYLGQSARAWDDAWKQSLARDIEASFATIQRSATAGEQRWHEARDFIAQYGGRALEQRWLDAANGIADAAAGRVGEQIVFDCDSPGDAAYCTELRALLEPKLARPITAETTSTAVRAAAFAIVSVRAEETLEEYRQTGGANSTGETARADIPKGLSVRIEVESHRGGTSWDGGRTVAVDAPLPAAFQWVNETASAQTRILREKMKASLAQLAPQTSAP